MLGGQGSLTDKMLFKKRCEGHEGNKLCRYLEKRVLGRGEQCGGPKLEWTWYSQYSKEASANVFECV